METKLKGNIHEFKAKAAEAGEMQMLSGKLCIPDPDRGLLPLCGDQGEAQTALRAIKNLKGKAEIPCVEGKVFVAYAFNGELKHESEGVTLKKIVFKALKGSPEAELHYTEPYLQATGRFFLEHLGADFDVSIASEEEELPLKGKKGKGKKA
jgi:hypothetical protein